MAIVTTKKKKKKPRMTQREKKWLAEWRAEMRAEGKLPPKKKPLNRKKFIAEARAEWNAANMGLDGYLYMMEAIGWTMSSFRPSLEDIGVAKVLKTACEIAKFSRELKERGQEKYTEEELYERLKPILEA